MRSTFILRRIGFAAAILYLVAFIFVQLQQRSFRHQVERLHSQILALQLHPGTFADIERLQREWGSQAHYQGPCNQHHCIYEIELNNIFIRSLKSRSYFQARFLLRLYSLVGGHPASASANVRIRDNRMWGADSWLMLWAYPGQGRNDGQPYAVMTNVNFGSRLLLDREEPQVNALQQGFRTDAELHCLGCEYVTIYTTPQTNSKDIERFNQINFDCITRFIACKHPEKMAPEMWAQAILDKSLPNPPEGQLCTIPLPILAREANDILLIKVLSLKPIQPDDGSEPGQSAVVQVLQPLKNGRANRTSDKLEFIVPPGSIRTQADETKTQLAIRKEYFFLYRQQRPDSIMQSLYLLPCHGMLNTPENAAAIKAGIHLDPSAGEPYDYQNERYVEFSE